VIRFHGVPFVVEPAALLSPADRSFLAEFPQTRNLDRQVEPFVITLESCGENLSAGAPTDHRADISWSGETIFIRHETFAAQVNPFQRQAALVRSRELPGPFPLKLTMETAVRAILPLEGAVVLHASSIVVEGKACVFFGPSGAGKSTLLERAPFPGMAEEFVILEAGRELAALCGEHPPPVIGTRQFFERAPLSALFELGRSESVEIRRLEPAHAVQAVLGSILVYPLPALWTEALRVVSRIASEVPVYHFGWSLQDEAWDALRAVTIEGTPARR
jgi:hypothetical protein